MQIRKSKANQTTKGIYIVLSNISTGTAYLEGREGVKWELRFAFFRGWEMRFCALGLGFMKQKQ